MYVSSEIFLNYITSIKNALKESEKTLVKISNQCYCFCLQNVYNIYIPTISILYDR